MKKITLILTALISVIMAQTNIYDFSYTSIDGKEVPFSTYKGKKILIVNTASECGFTPQYKDLQALWLKEQDNVVIIGFPANNFGKQEPGNNEEIATFCEVNYGVTFPLSEKVSVRGEDISPLFSWLIAQENDDFKGDINWNFEKILIDENGEVVHRYRSMTKPEDINLN